MPKRLALRHPAAAAGVVLAATIALCSGGGIAVVELVSSISGSPSATTTPSPVDASARESSRAQATASPAAAPSDAPVTGALNGDEAETALQELAALPVKDPISMDGYSPYEFGPAWEDADHNGCDTRNDILRRDLSGITTGAAGCEVLTGRLHDPYTGRTIRYRNGRSGSAAVHIDHVVSLADAWRTGAKDLSRARREQFGNDPLTLLAVDGPTSERKQGRNAASWLPPRASSHCAYVADQIAVKRAYGLWVTGDEHDAMLRVLAGCGGGDTTSGPATGTPSPQHRTASHDAGGAASPTAGGDASDSDGGDDAGSGDGDGPPLTAREGAPCRHEGAFGVGPSGRLLTCTGGDGDATWQTTG